MSQWMQLPARINTLHLVRPRLDVYYPLVQGLENPRAQGKINRAIRDLVESLIREQGYYQNPQTTISGTYELKNNQRNILSLSIINYAFSGGAHGLTIIKSLTIDTETGQIYTLPELFKEGSDYITVISEKVKEQIRVRNIPLIAEFDQISPRQDFYVADKTLVIYFQLYDLTPYAYGLPHFPIPIYELESIIRPDSPLEKLMY